MLTMVARAMKTPRCHGGCEREEQPPRQRPLRCGCRHLNASLLLYPALLTEPASGREAEYVRFTTGRFLAKAPCGTPRCGVFVSLSPAAEDGGPRVASAPGQPRSGFRGVEPCSTSFFFTRLPTGSFQQQQIRPSALRAVQLPAFRLRALHFGDTGRRVNVTPSA